MARPPWPPPSCCWRLPAPGPRPGPCPRPGTASGQPASPARWWSQVSTDQLPVELSTVLRGISQCLEKASTRIGLVTLSTRRRPLSTVVFRDVSLSGGQGGTMERVTTRPRCAGTPGPGSGSRWATSCSPGTSTQRDRRYYIYPSDLFFFVCDGFIFL